MHELINLDNIKKLTKMPTVARGIKKYFEKNLNFEINKLLTF